MITDDEFDQGSAGVPNPDKRRTYCDSAGTEHLSKTIKRRGFISLWCRLDPLGWVGKRLDTRDWREQH